MDFLKRTIDHDFEGVEDITLMDLAEFYMYSDTMILSNFNTLVQRNSLKKYCCNIIINVWDELNQVFRATITFLLKNGKDIEITERSNSKFKAKVKVIKSFIIFISRYIRDNYVVKFFSVCEAKDLYNVLIQSKRRQNKLGLSNVKQITYNKLDNGYIGKFSFKYGKELIEFISEGTTKNKIMDCLMFDFMSWYNHNIAGVVEATGEMDESNDNDASVITGSMPLDLDVSKETVISSAVGTASTLDLVPLPAILRSMSAGSIISNFEDLTERWLQIDNFRLVRETGETVYPWRTLELPKDILKYSKKPNVLPFKQYKIMTPIEMEIKVKVNSNKFNQGRLCISYLNDGAQMQVGDLSEGNNSYLSFRSIYQAIQRDHVMLDLNESNEATLKIPFLSTKNFIPIYASTQEYPFSSAVLDIHVLSQLRVPDEAQSFVNGLVFVKFNKVAFTAFQPAVDNYNSLFADGQMDDGVSADGQVLPLAAMAAGALLSGALKPIAGGLGNMVSGIVSNIPIIGGLFKSSPVLGTLSPKRCDGGERSFDNSMQVLNADKPASHEQPIEFRPNAVGDMAIAIKTQPQFSMRLDCSALTPQLPLVYPATPIQSIFELNRIWSYVTKFTWSATQQTVGEEIFTIPIHPLHPIYSRTTFGTYGQMYEYYSGSIEYRFEFVGTQFHTGAVSIGYVPFENDFTMEDSKSAFYKLFDLRDEKQVGFHVPYIDTTVLRTTNADETVGQVKFFVQNPLVPIGSVTQEVQVLVFARFGPDAHYTFIRNPNYTLADGQMDTGDKETNEETTDFGLISGTGVVANIAEDHELIHDIIKRYVSYNSWDITSQRITDMDLNKTLFNQTNSKLIMQGFRFARGSYTLTLVFKKKPQNTVRFVRSRDVTIIPMDNANNTTITALPPPQSIGSIAGTSMADQNVLGPLNPPISTFSLYQGATGPNMFWYANSFPVLRPDNPPSGEMQTQVTNQDFNPITTDGQENVTRINTNNTNINTWTTQARSNLNYAKTTLDDVKTAMDTNTGINTFNNAVNSSTNALINKVNDVVGVYNNNATNTNINNSAIVAAIDEGSGGVIAAELPTVVTISYKPNELTGHFKGGPTQLILTNINQTVKLNIPFYNIYNYQDFHYKLTTYPKEKQVLSIGHLLITTSDPVDVDIYWSAGDDFYMTKYIGAPLLKNNVTMADGQMDTPKEVFNHSIMDEYLVDGEMDQLQNAVVDSATPIVSSFYHVTKDRVYDSVFSAKKAVVAPVLYVKNTLNKYDTLADSAQELMDTIKSTADKILEYLTGQFKWLSEWSTLGSSIIHLVQALINPTLSSVCLAISGILVNLGLASFELATKMVSVIVDSLSKTAAPAEQHTGAQEAEGQCDHDCMPCDKFTYCSANCKKCSDERGIFDKDTCATLAGLILSSISAALGFKAKVKTDGVFSGLFKISSSFWSSLNGSVTFLKNLFTVFDRIWKRVLKTDSNSAVALALTSNRADIIAFVKESQAMLSLMNESAINTNPDQKRRFWLCVSKAYTLQTHLLTSNAPEKRTLLLQCEKVIKRANEIGNKAMNCPVRYEPFVLGLKGQSKLGKSFLLNALLPDVLKEVYDYQSYTPPIYVRSPGTEYWNGYTDQPAIVYDDFLATTEPTMAGRQITELFGLKSSAIFNCNMANLEDKEKNANPFIVALAMNKAVIPNAITEPQAFLRRKDSFWIVKPHNKLGDVPENWKLGNYTEEQLKNFEHLKFCKVKEVTDEHTVQPGIPYAEFKKAIIAEAKQYHEREKKNVQFRFEKLMVTLPEVAQEMSINTDPFAIFYASCLQSADNSPVQNGLLPSELIALRTSMTNNAIATVTQHQQANARGQASTSTDIIADGQIDMISPLYTFFDRMKRLPRDFVTRLWCFVNGRPAPDLRGAIYGQCSACLEENVELAARCTSNVVHGYCSTCVLGVRTARPQVLEKCAMCRGVMHIELDSTMKLITDLMKKLASSSWAYARKIFKKPSTWLLLGSFGFFVLDMWFLTTLTYVEAQNEALEQKFYHNVFKQDYYGGIETKFGFTTFNPHKNAPPGDCGSYILPFEVADKETGLRMWSYLQTGINDDAVKFGIGDPYSINIQATGEVDDNEQEEVNGVTITWYAPPPNKERPSGRCKHGDLLNLPVGGITYEYNGTDGSGYWEDDDDNRWYDGTCGKDCLFTIAKRKEFIKANVSARATTYKLILSKLANGIRESEHMIPRVLLNHDYMEENRVALQTIISRIEQHQSLSLIDRLTGVFCKIAKGVAIAMACGGAIVACVCGAQQLMKFMNWSKEEDNNVDGQLTSSGDFKTMKLKRNTKPAKAMFARGQAGNLEHLEDAITKISTNTIIISLDMIDRNGERKFTLFRALGLYGRTCIITKHEMMYLLNNQDRCSKDNIQCIIKVKPFSRRGNNDSKEMEREITIDHRSVKHPEGDIVFWELPVKFPQFKDIVNLVSSRAQHSTQVSSLTMIACDTRANVIHRVSTKLYPNVAVVKTIATQDYDMVTSHECYQTNYSKKGHCGSIGVVESNNPILCYHFSGKETEGIGFSLPLVREDIIEFRNDKVPYSYLIPELAIGQAAVPLDGDYWSVGLVPKKLTPYLSDKTKIIPSCIQGKIRDTEVLTQPGILSAKDPRYKFEGSPLKWGCDKHLRPPIDLPQNLVDLAGVDIRNMLIENCEPLRLGVGKLDIVEAVTGMNLDYYDPIKLDTSSGYPYNLSRLGSKKSNLITINRDASNEILDIKINADLISDIEENNALRENGVRPFTVFQDTLKDERRKQRKLEMKDGTRVFSQSPVDFTISTRQYYLDFAAAYMKHRYHLEHAVGINVNSNEWTLVAQKLLNKGNNIISGDFSDFGPRIWHQLVIKACEIMDNWYSHFNENTPKTDSLARKVIGEEIATTYHICNNHIYMVYCGIPSGHALITILNSLAHKLLIRICWLLVTKKTLDDMKKHISLIVYGDDHLISVSDEYKEIFNCETISKLLMQYDFKYTDAKKTGNIKYTKLRDAEFLKCGFKPHPSLNHKFLAPLDKISVEECAQWIFSTADIKLATKENAEQSIRLAFGHGPKYFNEWRDKVNEALRNEGISTINLEWEDLNANFFPDELEYTEEGYIRISHAGYFDVEDEICQINHIINPFKHKKELREGNYYEVNPELVEYINEI